MNRTKIIAGIELGSNKTVTVVAQVSIDESYTETINIIGVSQTTSKGVKKGQIVNIEESVESAIACAFAASSAAIAASTAAIESCFAFSAAAFSSADGPQATNDNEATATSVNNFFILCVIFF